MLVLMQKYELNSFFLSVTLQTSFLTLLTFILSGKKGKSLCNMLSVFGYSISTTSK